MVNFDERFEFFVLDTGEVPTIPVDLEVISPVKDVKPDFEWIASDNPDGAQIDITYNMEIYTLGVSALSQISTLTYSVSGISGASAISAVIDYEITRRLPNGSYLARIRGVDTDGEGPWTDFLMFNLRFPVLPRNAYIIAAPPIEKYHEGMGFFDARTKAIFDKLNG